ncbi:N-acyl amino acid synthase FeeM domain-containing protein [Tundrisphaera lichenicola]|uniref:N-acyl amino acid synthase FeeM domain-containing protein n=1 Tax=Tundrisphaera lichenicola TaxID=2029860 RepID=UPI003EBD8DE6
MTDHAARRGVINVEGTARNIEVMIASGFDDFEQAYLLLARKYRARGYEDVGSKLFRFTPFHVLPGTITVIARDRDQVVATLSMVPDTCLLGLPMESVYPEDLARFRAEGRRLGEVTCLADEGLGHREFLGVFQAMIRLVQQYHVRIGGDTWVITVNPRHTSFYQKVMGALPFGVRKAHPSVANAPAEALYTDQSVMRTKAPRTYDRIFGVSLPMSVLSPLPRPLDHATFFGEHSSAADSQTIRRIEAAVEQIEAAPRWWSTTIRESPIFPLRPAA